jgi:polygalacturonase
MAVTKVTYSMIDSAPLNVLDFGAVGDGVADDSAAFQLAIDAAVGKTLFIPKPSSKYVVTGLLIPSNIIIEGEGYDTIIEMKQDANAFARMFLINGLTGQPKFNIAVRNLHFKGTVVADGFSEFRHLFYMWGASNITIENNWFTGWQGDALDIVQTPGTEDNENITVQNNVFDGVNNDNRNAISVIGCDKLLIDNNLFKNCTRSNMPGAIDIEPNSGYTFIKLNAVTISNNRFENIGGNVGAMAMFLPVFSENFVEHPKNITIENNTFSDVFRGIHCTQLQSANVNDSDPVINLQIINNKVDAASDRAFWLYGLNGVIMENNTYQDCANGSRIGWSDANRGCNNVKLRNNTFIENGTVDGYAIQSYQSNRIQFYENTFIDTGVSAGGFGVCINFVTASVSNIRIIDNNISNPSGRTTGAVGKTGAITISYDQNILQMNNFAGLLDAATSAPQWFSGTGSPETVVVAPIGSLYVNVSGGASTTLYIKESGSLATGWIAK